ncbi:hypothetical protein LguiA_003230 [Lonicera macranthoides]
MGVSNSKSERSDALRLCKGRKKFIKQAIDSRYNFAAAHVTYIQSLKNIGIALRRFAEAEVVLESSLSTSVTEIDKTPSQSSYPSPSPPHLAGVSDSPANNGSPFSPHLSRLSYMRSRGTSAVTISVNPSSSSTNMYVDDGESMGFTMPPPPPPPESGSWDYFDPHDDGESFRFVRDDGLHLNLDDEVRMYAHVSGKEDLNGNGHHEANVALGADQTGNKVSNDLAGNDQNEKALESEQNGNGLGGNLMGRAASERSGSKNDKAVVVKKDVCEEREDPSEFITHRAKDFLSSIKDIEHRFFRASESGKVVSRMLEANKIRVGYSEAKETSNVVGRSPASAILANFQPNCCGGKAFDSNETSQNVAKIITWKRTTSSRSSSSRNPLTTTSKDDNEDSGSDFVEEFCMIAGSHSSTLDRLYAWERKLYDEVKASERIRKEYDRKCEHLKELCAKDLSGQVIDKTRAVVKDLHSRIRVALHAVDSISKRIEKMRDDELQPQLVELIQGLIGMWKAMLECHHAQYITISLAYHSKTSTGTPEADSKRQITAQLEHEIECFGLSFADCTNSLTSYVESLNGWLQNCILQPRERKGRRAFSPRRVVGPPIIVLCRDWMAGIKSLPSQELSDAIKAFLTDLHRSSAEQEADELQKKQRNLEDKEDGDNVQNDDDHDDDNGCSYLSGIHTSLTKVLDRLTKFSEASLKMYEDIRLKTETARNAYSNYKPPRSMSI